VDRFKHKWNEATAGNDKKALDELELFRKDLATFVRMYDFLSQIINYGDTGLESRNIFYRHLIPLLKTENLKEPIDLSKVHLSHYRLKHLEQKSLPLESTPADGAQLEPASAAGSGVGRDPAKALLQEIIAKMNEVFEGEVTDADALTFAYGVRDKMLESPTLREQARHNSKAQFALGDFKTELLNAVIASLDSYQDKAGQVLSNEKTRATFSSILLDMVYDAALAQSATPRTE
jgi:type I restriction enzyme R subunit